MHYNYVVQDEDISALKMEYQEGAHNGDAGKDVSWAGCGVGRVNEETTAEEVLEKLVQETIVALKEGSTLLQSTA